MATTTRRSSGHRVPAQRGRAIPRQRPAPRRRGWAREAWLAYTRLMLVLAVVATAVPGPPAVYVAVVLGGPVFCWWLCHPWARRHLR